MAKKFIAIFALLATVLLPSCGKKEAPKAEAKAANEASSAQQELTVYTALEDDEIVVYMKDFKAKYPNIKVNLVRNSTGIITSKLLAEKDAPKADVIWGVAATSLLVCDQNDMLTGYNPKTIDTILPAFKDTTNTEAHWVGIKAWMTGFVCNTVEVEKNKITYPKSYQDLLKPEYKGHLIMPNPASSGTGFLTISAILQNMGEEKGWAFLDKLHDNISRYTHSGSKPAKLAGKGETTIGISFGYRGTKQKKKGEPVKTFFPAEKSGWDVEANGLVKKETINPTAKTFLDWAISKDAMTMYSKVYPVIATGAKVEVPDADYPAVPSEQLAKNDFQWAAKNRARILEEWAKRYDGKSDPK